MSGEERRDDPSRPEETTDVLAKLVRDARAGDERAFCRLAERVRARVFRWALARTGDPDEADDVTQDVLLRLHRHLDGFAGRARFDTWLYRITANAAASARSREATARGRPFTTGTHSPAASSHAPAARSRPGVIERRAPEPLQTAEPSGGEEPEARIFAGRVAELVRAYFEELPARQREVFDLVDLQGYAPVEVAEMLEMNRATVRANLFKARRTIRGRILAIHPELAEGYG